ADTRPEAEGGMPRDAALSTALETLDPRALPQHRLLRQPGLRRRRGRTDVLLQTRIAADRPAGSDDRRPAAGADPLRPSARPERSAAAAQRGARCDAQESHAETSCLALRAQPTARPAARHALHDDPGTLLLRLRRPAARAALRPAARQKRRAACADDDRPEAAAPGRAHG